MIGQPRSASAAIRRRPAAWATGLLGVAALSLSACGSATSAAAGAGLSGAPIKVMSIGTFSGSYATPYPQIGEVAKVYGKWINDHGGINGHPLQVLTCDDQAQPNQADICARQAVSQRVVAVVGSFTINEDRIVQVLEKAGIAYFGNCCPTLPGELVSPVSFPLGDQIGIILGEAAAAAKNCKNIGLVNTSLSAFKTFLDGLIKQAIAPYGAHIAAETYVPLTPVDMTPFVADVTQGTDCILIPQAETQVQEFLGPLAQSGATQPLIGMQGNIDSVSCAHHWSVCNNATVVGEFPDISSSVWTDFRAALKTYNANSSYEYNSLAGLGSWAAYTAFTNIAKGITGTLDAGAFLNAVRHASNVSTGGATPPLDFTHPSTTPGMTQVFNHTVTLVTISGQDFKPLYDGRFFDTTPSMAGKQSV